MALKYFLYILQYFDGFVHLKCSNYVFTTSFQISFKLININQQYRIIEPCLYKYSSINNTSSLLSLFSWLVLIRIACSNVEFFTFTQVLKRFLICKAT